MENEKTNSGTERAAKKAKYDCQREKHRAEFRSFYDGPENVAKAKWNAKGWFVTQKSSLI